MSFRKEEKGLPQRHENTKNHKEKNFRYFLAGTSLILVSKTWKKN